jgi:hypothetical protein
MTQMEIVEELKKLTSTKRLTIIEAALHLIREALQPSGAAAGPDREKAATGCGG